MLLEVGQLIVELDLHLHRTQRLDTHRWVPSEGRGEIGVVGLEATQTGGQGHFIVPSMMSVLCWSGDTLAAPSAKPAAYPAW